MTHIEFQTPAQFIVFTVFPVIIPEIAEVVDVSSLCADYLTEHTVLRHVQRIHLKPVIAAVFQNEAVLACCLAQVDKIPAFLQVHGRRYLDGYVLAVLQCTFGNGEVVQPVCGDIYQINIITFTKFLVTCLTRVDCRFRHRSFL